MCFSHLHRGKVRPHAVWQEQISKIESCGALRGSYFIFGD